MRTLLMTAVLLSVAVSAEAQRVPYAAPNLAARPPVLTEPKVAPPGQVMVPDMSVPAMGGLPAPAAPMLDAMPQVIAPPAPLANQLTLPVEPLAPLPTAPRLDPNSTHAPTLTSPEDVVEEVRQLQRSKRLREERRAAREARGNAPAAGKPDAPPATAVPSPVARVPAIGNPVSADSPNQPGDTPDQAASSPGPTAAPGPTTGREEACSPAGDLTKLLSSACLETLRALRAPGGGLPPPPAALGGYVPQQQQAMTQCAVSIFAATGQNTMVPPFQAVGLEACLAMGARLNYGVPGVSNITAVDPVWGVVAVSCRRESLDGGAAVTCEPQQ